MKLTQDQVDAEFCKNFEEKVVNSPKKVFDKIISHTFFDHPMIKNVFASEKTEEEKKPKAPKPPRTPRKPRKNKKDSESTSEETATEEATQETTQEATKEDL